RARHRPRAAAPAGRGGDRDRGGHDAGARARRVAVGLRLGRSRAMIGRRLQARPGSAPTAGARARRRNGEIGIALILIGLIIVPSGLLGYLSWRAIENERSYSEERVRESYRRIARLAGLEIDRELHELESRWAAELGAMAAAVPSGRSSAGPASPHAAPAGGSPATSWPGSSAAPARAALALSPADPLVAARF